MENSEIQILLLSETSDKELIKLKIIDAFNSRTSGLSVQSFFYQLHNTVDNLKIEFKESRNNLIERYESSTKFNRENDVENKFEMNAHNLREISKIKSGDYFFNKSIYVQKLSKPYGVEVISFKESFFQDIETIILEVKKMILSSRMYNTRLQLNEFPQIFSSDLAYSIFIDFHEMVKDNDKNYNANYSFIFLELEREKAILCNGKEFLVFLLKTYQIKFNKIDYRKIGSKRKMDKLSTIRNRLLFDL
ncbi:MAG: hypothetical protein GYB35_09885 [Algicola sp.]|nr:hypothetical protein [Algicola sp.]